MRKTYLFREGYARKNDVQDYWQPFKSRFPFSISWKSTKKMRENVSNPVQEERQFT